MKKLKGFVQQRNKTDGCMVKGYIVYELLYYAIAYNKQINHTPGTVIWDDECDEDKRYGEVLEMNEKKRRMLKSKSLIFQSSSFHIVTIHNKLQNIYCIPYVLNVVLFP